jgi:hypothetical protein
LLDKRRRIPVISQSGLEKGATILEIGGLCYGHSIQSDPTPIEERMQKVIPHRREIRVIQIRPVCLGQFTSNVEFYIRIYVRVIVGLYDKL